MPRPSMRERRQDVENALRAAGGDPDVAARALGITRSTFYQRTRRAGVDMHVLAYQIREETAGVPHLVPKTSDTPDTDARLEQDGQGDTVVRLSLGQYAVLQAQAAEGVYAADLARDLDTANRIIATLTARLHEVAA